MTNDKMKDTLRIFVVPTEILDVELDVYEKMVYMVLRSYANGQDDTAFPSYETIAKKGSMGRKKAIQCIKKLEEMGLVVKEERKMVKNGSIVNTSNLYTIKRPAEVVSEKHHPSVSETPPLVSDRHHPSVPQTPEKNYLKKLNLKTKNNNSSRIIGMKQIDLALKEKYPNAPFEEIREQVESDDTLTIDTYKQYESILEYRLKNWRPAKTKKKKATRTEIIPEHFYKENNITVDPDEVEAKKASIAEKLARFRS
jgi:hypothetical protein